MLQWELPPYEDDVCPLKELANNEEWEEYVCTNRWNVSQPFFVVIAVNFLKCTPRAHHEKATLQINYIVMSSCDASAGVHHESLDDRCNQLSITSNGHDLFRHQ